MSTHGLFIIGLIVVLAALIFINNRPPAEEVSPAGETAAAQIERVLQEGKPAWLFFRTSSCPACVELKRSFDSLQEEYEGRVVFIDINLDDDRNGQLGREYRIGYVPQTYIINAEGQTTYQMVGTIPVEELRSELDKAAESMD